MSRLSSVEPVSETTITNATINSKRTMMMNDTNNKVSDEDESNDESSISIESKLLTQQQSVRGVWYSAALFIAFNHLVCLYTLMCTSMLSCSSYQLYAITLFISWLQLLGITAGYHRLWSHNAYKAHISLRILLSIIGLMSFQGSIRWWVLRHRLHHRFTDHPLFDPHSVKQGLFHSHMGWLFKKPNSMKSKLQYVNTKDLDSDIVVIKQKQFILYGYIIFGALMPMLIGHLTGDGMMSGLIMCGFFARLLSWHAIWSINSISHWLGDRLYAHEDHSTAVHSWLFAIFQNGEQHHNYHHSFPNDYRHGIKITDWDPTKWCINLWFYLGLASDLRTVNDNSVKQAIADVLHEQAQNARKSAIWPVDVNSLPSMTMKEFSYKVESESLPWIIINGLICDVGHFDDHPGGDNVVRLRYGLDCTKVFEGGQNMHSQAAHRLVKMYAVSKIIQSNGIIEAATTE